METLLSDSWFSLQRVLTGVAAAVIFGVSTGLLRSQAPSWLKRNPIFRFLLEAPKFPPPIAWIPFVILWFGIGETSAVVIVVIGAFAPLFTASYDGAESIPLIWRQTAASLGVSNGVFIREILFKGALPQIFSGLRVALGMGWMSVIAAEMISGQSGLGYSIQLHRLNLQYTDMIADMIAIGTIGFILYEAVNLIERFVLPWHERGARP